MHVPDLTRWPKAWLVGAVLVSMIVAMPVHAATFEEGQAAASEGDPARAIFIWKKLAEAGHAEAQYWLAQTHWGGWWGVPQDLEQVAKWLTRAAEQGHSPALVDLGNMHAEGWHFSQNEALAAAWFRRAAEAGNADGQYYLGHLHLQGRGVPRNAKETLRLWRLAYAGGHEGAGLDLCAEFGESCAD